MSPSMAYILFTALLYVVVNGQTPSPTTPTAAPTFSTLPHVTEYGTMTITKLQMTVSSLQVAEVGDGERIYFDYVPAIGSKVSIIVTFDFDRTKSGVISESKDRVLLFSIENSDINRACYEPLFYRNSAYGRTLVVSYTHDDTPRHISIAEHFVEICGDLQCCDNAANQVPDNEIGFISVTSPGVTSIAPSISPTKQPTSSSSPPTSSPTIYPTDSPLNVPSVAPTNVPTQIPAASTLNPSFKPSLSPNDDPTSAPTTYPSTAPTKAPITGLKAVVSPTTAKAPSFSPLQLQKTTENIDIGMEFESYTTYVLILLVVIGVCACFACVVCIIIAIRKVKQKKSAAQQESNMSDNANNDNVNPGSVANDKKYEGKQGEEDSTDSEKNEGLYDHEGMKRIESNTTKGTPLTPHTSKGRNVKDTKDVNTRDTNDIYTRDMVDV